MSSAAYLTFDEPVTTEQWEKFCEARGIVFSPNTIGRCTFYQGQVEIHFGEPNYDDPPHDKDGRIAFDQIKPPTQASRITVSTYWMGEACLEVAKLATELWWAFRGSLAADPEIMAAILRDGYRPD